MILILLDIERVGSRARPVYHRASGVLTQCRDMGSPGSFPM
jgi:hypothetical protein